MEKLTTGAEAIDCISICGEAYNIAETEIG